MDTLSIMAVGLIVNMIGTAAGFVGLLLKFENRMTKLETHLVHILPKRKGDYETN